MFDINYQSVFVEITMSGRGFGKIRITHRNFDKFAVIPKCTIYIHLLINQNVYKPDSYLPHTQLD
jgi:hypothetical protein